MPPRLCIIQARAPGDAMLVHEQQCFERATGLEQRSLRFYNLVDGVPTFATVRGHDAVMVGGSGAFYISRPEAHFFHPFQDLLSQIVKARMPMFASCFGYQALVVVLGGEVIHDPEKTEVGTFELRLTEAGQRDELFSVLPQRLNAQLGHKDRASRQPEGIPNLAASALSPYQALRVPGCPVWASQFHPELDEPSNRERFLTYLDDYKAKGVDAEEVLQNFAPSPEASSLLRRFVELLPEL